jgi:hypothetical protein
MAKRSTAKSYEFSKEGRIVIYPKLHGIKERAPFRVVTRLLKRLKKGH